VFSRVPVGTPKQSMALGTKIVLAALAVLAVLFIIGSCSGGSGSGAAAKATCSQVLSDLSSAPADLSNGDGYSLSVAAAKAGFTAQDDGAGQLNNDLGTLGDDSVHWQPPNSVVTKQTLLVDLQQVYADCGQTYHG
jgi:hypothetical protein